LSFGQAEFLDGLSRLIFFPAADSLESNFKPRSARRPADRASGL